MKFLRKIIPYLVIVLFLLPAVLPLLPKGFFVTDDGNWMVIRLSAFHEALRTGQFPVRFLPRLNHGYGYPVLDFLYPLPFYLAEVAHLMGFSFVDSIKMLFLLSFIFSAYFMYLFVAVEWGIGSGILAAAFYSLAPYRLFDVYKRGSVGEAVAFIFPPLIFYFLRRFEKDLRLRNLSLAALSFAALITAHNVIAFLFFPTILIYLAFKVFTVKKSPKLIIYYLLFFILSLTASAWFWFPALFDLQFTRSPSVVVSTYHDYFLSVNSAISLVGFVIPAVLIASTLIIIQKRDNNVLAILSTALISILFASSISDFAWRFLPLPRLVQFPWRFLSLTVFAAPLLLGYLVQKTKLYYIPACLLIILAASLISFPQIIPTNYPDSYYATNDDTTTVKNEYMPKWVRSDPVNRPLQKLEIVSGQGSVVSDYEIQAVTPVEVTINQVFFPGQTVLDNGTKSAITPDSNGLLSLSLPPGKHDITMAFAETSWRLVADLVSAVSLIICFILLFI